MKSFITSFDSILIASALLIMMMGLSRRWSLWRTKKDGKYPGSWSRLIDYLVKHAEIRKRPLVGAIHMVVLWGFVLPVIVIILGQFGFVLPQSPARLLSLLQEAAGIAALGAVLFFLVRRIQSANTGGPKNTLLPMIILLTILISGFLAEGARLAVTGSVTAWSSPVGWVLSAATPASPLFMQLMIRLHFFAVLVFIALIPFTFMRHLAAVPLNVYYKKQGPRAALRQISPKGGEVGAQTVADFSWKQLLETEACVSCGRCEENCPAAISGKPLSPRKVIRGILEQMEAMAGHRNGGGNASPFPLLENAITDNEIWACTTCMACVTHCPVFTEAMDKIVDMRRWRVMGMGQLPAEARPMIRDLELYGDVQGKGIAHRTDWAMHRNVSRIEVVKDAEILLWVGCSGAFHPRNQETMRAMVKILNAAGTSFGILGPAETCCGDPARRLGDETLFQKLAQKNIAQFQLHKVRKIVTLCPHCLNTLKNEYPALGCEIPVVHATEFALELIHKKKITLKYPVADKIAIHDACYLGRYNAVYEPPRSICAAIPGTRLKEPERNRENGFCCGGGGGRMWLHENIGKNINLIRAEELAATDVDVIGTACPYCLVMLDDGVKSLETTRQPKVMDIIDIVATSIA
ncbi:MAG: heterodisulfide reductase-related iron-sulfur binding cluster [Pseudomonadota bacterium]